MSASTSADARFHGRSALRRTVALNGSNGTGAITEDATSVPRRTRRLGISSSRRQLPAAEPMPQA